MSQTRYTPITSSLLARKGDAVPSAVPSAVAVKPSLFWARADAQEPPLSPPTPVERPKAAVTPPGPPEIGKPHKMVVMLTATEYEKLGIAAVKKGVTRHQIVRTALDLHLDRLKREYGGCGCMAMGESCSEGCADG
ncbi:MAG: hypothetical protein ACXWLQ_09745 [Rhizomicrobium sp.]